MKKRSISKVKVKLPLCRKDQAKLRNASRDCLNRSLRYGRDDKGRCEDCSYSVASGGRAGRILTCRNKADAPGRMWVVEADECCGNFTRDKELLAPELVQALSEGAKLIPLTQDKYAIVDAEDYEQLRQYKWYAKKGYSTYYAGRGVRVYEDGRYEGVKQKLMHRLITNAPAGMLVDHRNHNGLDNRRENMRVCTREQNSHNQRPYRGSSCGYKGVTLHKRDGVFEVNIRYKGNLNYIGRFKDADDAARAYDKKAKELFGEFAYLNFPGDRR